MAQNSDPWANYSAMSGAMSHFTGRYGFTGGLKQGVKGGGLGPSAGPSGQPGQPGQLNQPGMQGPQQQPQTGLMQLGQMAGAARGPQALGAGLRNPGGPMAGPPQGPPALPGTTSIKNTGDYLARLYGLDMSGDGLVDEAGTFLRPPRDADEAAKFNLISQRLADEQQRQSQQKAMAALQGEVGLLSKAGRGSLATIQSGTLRAQAQMYGEQQFAPTDFGYWIAKEFAQKQENLARYIAKQQKKAAKYQMYGDIAKGAAGIAIGAFCWVAEELFGKFDPRTHFARAWCAINPDHWFVKLYRRHGERWALTLQRHRWLRPCVSWIWKLMARAGQRFIEENFHAPVRR